MPESTREGVWLADFRRAARYLGPHRRPLIIGLLAALGVSIFYTFSISSVIPLLQVLFSEHETLPVWLERVETERRAGVTIRADQPDAPEGLLIERVAVTSPNHNALRSGDRIVALAGQPRSSYAVVGEISRSDKPALTAQLAAPDGAQREVRLTLKPAAWWHGALQFTARQLPESRDAAGRFNALATVMAALLAIAVIGGVCKFLNEGMIALAVQRAMHDLRSRLADHVLRLPLAWHTRQPPGDTLGRFANDLSKLEVGISTLFGKSVREPLKAVGVLTLTALIDWKLLVVSLVCLPIGAGLIQWLGRRVKHAQRRASLSWGRLLDLLGERLAAIRTVKASNMELRESRRFDEEGRRLTKAQTQIELVDAATNPALEALSVLGVAAFVLYGGSRVFTGQLEPHMFFAAMVCLGGIFDPVRKLGNVNNRVQQADAAARRLFELLDLTPEESTRAEPAVARAATQTPAAAPPQSPAHLVFEDVSFAYEQAPQRPVLSAISLEIGRGELIALVGPNGSGKTTLVSLLLRFYEPTGGRILIDGQDVRATPLAQWRARIGYVAQDAVVFSDTVHANIAYGANGASREQVRAAAQRAHIDDFLSTLRVEHGGRALLGYDAPINARSLSGGQRQRIAIARAILRDPPILILDEATSQVDSESERKIQEALDDVRRGRTTIVIAHRYSTIARADRIVVLNEGQIVAIGRHEELLRSSHFYDALCETQFATS